MPNSAGMPDSKLDLVVTTSAVEVWEIIGPFGSVATWHPLVVAAELSHNGSVRTLTLTSGAVQIEKELSRDELSYRYALQSSVLPVEFFSGELVVAAVDERRARIVWEADYAAHNVSDEVAKAAVDGYLAAPAEALRARFG